MLDKFSNFSGLKMNNANCEIPGIGVKYGFNMALCGMEYIDLTDNE